MENTAYLRRQALFYLRLSHLCLDPPLAAHLRVKAAEFHERALRAEFEPELDLHHEPALNQRRGYSPAR
jgi:hypothetical protein